MNSLSLVLNFVLLRTVTILFIEIIYAFNITIFSWA